MQRVSTHQVSLNLIKPDSQNKFPNTHLEEGISLLTTAEADDSEDDSFCYLCFCHLSGVFFFLFFFFPFRKITILMIMGQVTEMFRIWM